MKERRRGSLRAMPISMSAPKWASAVASSARLSRRSLSAISRTVASERARMSWRTCKASSSARYIAPRIQTICVTSPAFASNERFSKLAFVDAEQRVAAAQGVVEEGEGPVLCERHQPERELRHLDGQRVLVHAVEAALGHEAPGDGQPLVGVAGEVARSRTSPVERSPFGRDVRRLRLAAPRDPPTPRPAAPPGSGRPAPGTRPSPSPCRRPSGRADPPAGRSCHSSCGFPSAGPT